jgi:endonuclease YncB( thermonuclease family)
MKTAWLFAGLLLCGLSGHLEAEPITADQVRVMDGDTVRLHHQKPDVRLVGFNAPETKRAQCEAERELGDKATRRVRDLVRDQPLDFERVACSCPPGKEGTRFCNYGRWCGTLKAGGRDIGDILIAEGLAVPFKCYASSCPKTPRPWCEPKP